MGFNNPICEIWSGLLNQIYNAMRGSPMAITFCWAVLRAIIAGPGDAMMIINGTVGRFVDYSKWTIPWFNCCSSRSNREWSTTTTSSSRDYVLMLV